MMKISLFKKSSVTLLDEKWNVLKSNVKFKFIQRIYELIYLSSENGYYRVVNVIYNIDNNVDTYVVIQKYTDDFKLKATNDKTAPVTLVRLILAAGPLTEKQVGFAIFKLAIFSGILAIITAFIMGGSL